MTPHRGEFERLFSQRLPEDMAARRHLAQKLSKSLDAVLVLKSHRTLVVYRDKVYLNTTGNPGMAKGGSGDVLSGMISGMLAQGITTIFWEALKAVVLLFWNLLRRF